MNRRTFLAGAALALPDVSWAHVPFVVDLAPPENRYGEALDYNVSQWGWTGGALTASTYLMRFDQPMTIVDAQMLLVWWPLDTAYIRFVYFDGGPANLVGFHTHTEPDRGTCCPVPKRFNVTSTFQALANNGVPKHIGFQCHGHSRLARVQLQLIYG